jgi:hypothetical protein
VRVQAGGAPVRELATVAVLAGLITCARRGGEIAGQAET